MNFARDVYTRLNADSTLLAIATGGVYQVETLPTEGISREALPGAFGSSGFLNPLVVVRGRDTVPTSALRDANTQYTTATQVVECWLYDDADAGYSALDSMGQRIYALLQETPVTGAFACTLDRVVNGGRAPEMTYALFQRWDFSFVGRIKT